MSARSEAARTAGGPGLVSAKLVVTGGFGAGKTTLVGAISEMLPLRTEAAMTRVAAGVDDASLVAAKSTTTVAMDFGRLTIDAGLVLYLFGTPGQERFDFLWDDITRGALGALVVVDTRRLEDCYPAVDYVERRRFPFVIVVNTFDGRARHDLDEVRLALNIDGDVPVVEADVRHREPVRAALVALLERILMVPAG